MNKKEYILWGAATFIFLWMGATLIPEKKNDGTIPVQKRSEEAQVINAVTAAESAIDCGYSRIGYKYFTPSEAVQRYIEGQKRVFTAGVGNNQKEESVIQYTTGKADSSWQITLRADDKKKTIRITGYGTDLLNPIQLATISCKETPKEGL